MVKRAWPERKYTVEEAMSENPILWDKIRRMFDHLIPEDRAEIFSLVVDTCPHCYEDGKDCQCWNDM